MSHSKSLGIPWKNVMANIKSVKLKSTPKTILHKYTQRQLDTLTQARPILYKSVVVEGYEIVPEPQRVVVAPPVAEFATGLSTHSPKVEQKAKKTMTTENTVETPATPVAKKAAAKKVVKKVVKKTTTTVTTPKADKKAATKKAAPAKATTEGKAVEYGLDRGHDVAWNEKKVAVFKALKACKALDVGSAVSAQAVAEKDLENLDPRLVRHYCYHAKSAGLVGVVEVEGIRGYGFHLTAKGLKIDLKTILKAE